MSDQQDTLIEDQPLKVLGLFHKRQLQTIKFDQQKFIKLYDSLCCTICMDLFSNPVYLRCSHRFCKDCIEKYIRINDKRSCPNCRGDLTTKRDLRVDYGLKTLISYAFGDRNKFCQEIQEIQNAEAFTLQRTSSKTSAIVRTKSHTQQQQKAVRKKVKTNQQISNLQDSQTKIKKKRGRPFDSHRHQDHTKVQEQKSDNDIKIRLQNKYQTPEKDNFQQIQKQRETFLDVVQKVPEIQIIRNVVAKKRGRKKQIPIIQVKSHSSQQIPEEAPVVDYRKRTSNMDLQERIQGSKKQISKVSHFEAQTRCDPLQKQRNNLKQEFGDNYLFKLMKIPTLNFLIQINLQKHPDCFLTPVLPCKSIQLSCKAKLHHIYLLVAKMLNCPLKNLLLYTRNQKIIQLNYQLYATRSLGQLNEQLWKRIEGIDVFDMKQILSSLEDTTGQNVSKRGGQQINQTCKLFQGMSFNRQQRSYQGRKRGPKFKNKRNEQKQNVDVKKDFRRVIYYKLNVF